MFIEPNISGERRGWIEVICGSMFSGKTEELIRRLKRVKIANLKVEIFKPAIDVRYDEIKIVSHDENEIVSTPVDNSQKILLLAQGADVIGIDEAQFFDNELPYVCDQLAYKGIRVIVAGLDMDYQGKPFGQMPFLLAKADYTRLCKAHLIIIDDIMMISSSKIEANLFFHFVNNLHEKASFVITTVTSPFLGQFVNIQLQI